MKGFVAGAHGAQASPSPESLEDWVDESNAVRVIDVFVDALDLAYLGLRCRARGRGPASVSSINSPEALHLRLSLQGAVAAGGWSVRLAATSRRRGRCGGLCLITKPSQTSARTTESRTCARFVELCREMGLLAKASVAIDGSKFKAVNNRDKNFTQASPSVGASNWKRACRVIG